MPFPSMHTYVFESLFYLKKCDSMILDIFRVGNTKDPLSLNCTTINKLNHFISLLLSCKQCGQELLLMARYSIWPKGFCLLLAWWLILQYSSKRFVLHLMQNTPFYYVAIQNIILGNLNLMLLEEVYGLHFKNTFSIFLRTLPHYNL